jgi:hypothetical protein
MNFREYTRSLKEAVSENSELPLRAYVEGQRISSDEA